MVGANATSSLRTATSRFTFRLRRGFHLVIVVRESATQQLVRARRR